MTTRRQFLYGCSTLAFATALSPPALSAASVFSRNAEPRQVTYDAFSKCLGSTFVVKRQDQPGVALELIRARRQPASRLAKANALDARHEKFSLLFRGPRSMALDQNSYTFEHGEMGRFEIFIVRVGVEDKSHEYYEAIFNRPVAA